MPILRALITPVDTATAKWTHSNAIGILPTEVLLDELQNINYLLYVIEEPEYYQLTIEIHRADNKKYSQLFNIKKEVPYLTTNITSFLDCFELHEKNVHIFEEKEQSMEDCKKELFLKVCEFTTYAEK